MNLNNNKKNLFLIRHGYSKHNLEFETIGWDAYLKKDNIDPPLVESGINQAIYLSNNWSDITNIDLIVISPLKRCLETAKYIFKKSALKYNNIPIICHHSIREYPSGLHYCNHRSNKNYLTNNFKFVNFDLIETEEDLYWKKTRLESLDELDIRINEFNEWLSTRKEKNIAIISHCSFISRYLFGGDIQELEHCFPYKKSII